MAFEMGIIIHLAQTHLAGLLIDAELPIGNIEFFQVLFDNSRAGTGGLINF